jgi:hypothetical protein
MTMPDAVPRGKPPRRWGLFAPYILLLAAIAAWSVFWLVLRSQLEEGLVRQARDLRTSGYEASWKAMKIGGYPFRLEVELTDLKIAEPSGWGVAAPTLQAEANAYAPKTWVFVAPAGLTLYRPAIGGVVMTGQAIRASYSDVGEGPRIAFQGDRLVFATPTARGTEPFAFTAIDRVDFHLRPAAGDTAQFALTLDGAQTRRAGIFAQIAPLAPLSMTLETELTKASGFAGRDWSTQVRAWTAQGGQANVHQLLVAIGNVSLSAQGGPLTVEADGRLHGSLALQLRQGAPALTALGAAQGIDTLAAIAAASLGSLPLTFGGGDTNLGPLRVGPAPRIY